MERSSERWRDGLSITIVTESQAGFLCKLNYNDRYMKTPPPSEKERPSRRQFDRSKALDVAMELFWRHGYAATSMTMLLEALDLTAPSLYAAFGNKERLFQAAVERYAQTFGAKVMSPLNAPLPAREAIEQMLLNSAANVSSSKNPHGCLASFGAINASDHASTPVTLLREVRVNIEKRIRERLDRAVAERELPSTTDTARLARFYHAVLGGIQLRSLDGASKAELEAIAHDAMASWPASGRRRYASRAHY
jgi:TetR/AcrR family transcriptional regulator, copper-responsive repressor